MIKSFAILSLIAACVSAHGIVTDITIAGKSFKGNVPNSKSVASPIRLVTSGDPIKGAKNADVNCGRKAAKASLVVDAQPGDNLLVHWSGEDGKSKWPHNTGPMLTYLASCGSTPCNEFDTTKAKWFKIDQVGRKTTGDKAWVQQDLMNGAPASVNLPKNLAPGSYILRHEIIALHLATSLGGAEFYPSCAQINVGGSGTGTPEESELVSLPGAYSDNDPGIFDKQAFDTNAKYNFPGPKIAQFVSEKASNTSSSAPSTTTTTSSTKGSSKTCKKKSAARTAVASTSTAQPVNGAAAATATSSNTNSTTTAVIPLRAAISSDSASSSPTTTTSSESSTSTTTNSDSGYDDYDYKVAKRSISQQTRPRSISRVMRRGGLGFGSYGRM